LQLEDGHLSLSHSSHQVYNQFRGVTPEPGAFVLLDDERLKVLEARLGDVHDLPVGVIRTVEKKLYLGCSEGSLELRRIQPFGKQSMSAMDWFRGLRQDEIVVS
jgi:methionyl-tRNA formyltransferase